MEIKKEFSIKNTEYFRGIDGELYFSANIFVDGEFVGFYNSETSKIDWREGAEQKIINLGLKYSATSSF